MLMQINGLFSHKSLLAVGIIRASLSFISPNFLFFFFPSFLTTANERNDYRAMVRRPRGMRWPWLAMCVVSGSVLMTSSLVVANVSVADVTLGEQCNHVHDHAPMLHTPLIWPTCMLDDDLLVGGRQRTESDGVLLEDNIGEGTELPDHDTSDDDGSDETGNNESVDDTPAAIDFPSFAEWRDRKAEEKAVVDAAMVVNATDEPAAAGEDHRLTDGTKPSTESASTGITGDNSRVHMHADERQTTTPHTSGHSQQLSGAADRQHVPVITDAQAKATNDKNTNIDHAASDSVNNATSSSGTLAFTSAIHRERFNFASVFMGWLSTFLVILPYSVSLSLYFSLFLSLAPSHSLSYPPFSI